MKRLGKIRWVRDARRGRMRVGSIQPLGDDDEIPFVTDDENINEGDTVRFSQTALAGLFEAEDVELAFPKDE